MPRPVFILTTLLILAATASAVMAQGPNNISSEELRQRLTQPQLSVVIDTRTEREYRRGHIPGASNIPPTSFINIAELLPKNKNTPLVFYCRNLS
ncbi:MAG: rhodanese-like domain-containing protein [Desulfobulbaceae bacterium]|nr:MAG: rhodanese-like domain-containing protein [Desulfobulbaceae bacterium]